MSSPLPPILLDPILKPKPWGGDRLAKVLGKAARPGTLVGESWEAVSLRGTSNPIREGPGAGGTLEDLLTESGPEVIGPGGGPSLPLLFKYLDAQLTLSLQVHPDHDQAEKLAGVREGKTEAWRIIDAAPGAIIHLGLRPGIGRADLERALEEGRALDCLQSFPARPGDTYLIRAGSIHTVGGGVLFAEVQEPSGITYRFTDFDRTDRETHPEEAFSVTDFDRVGPFRIQPGIAEAGDVRREVFRCRAFDFEVLEGDGWWDGLREGGFEIVSVARGSAEVITSGGQADLPLGGTALLPADRASLGLRLKEAIVMRAYLPSGT